MGRGPASEPIPHLARALRALRLRAGLSQEQVSERVRAGGEGLSRTYYQQIESGRRHPSPDVRAAILAVLGATDEDLPGAARAPVPARGAPRVRTSGPVVHAAAAPAGPRQGPPGDLAELRDIARGLHPDDLGLLVDIARTLARRRAAGAR